MTYIAYDRYYAICKPLQFNARKTKVAKIIGGIWTAAGIIGIPDFSLESKSPFDKEGGVAYNPCMSDDILFDLSACTSNWNKDVDLVLTVTKVNLHILHYTKMRFNRYSTRLCNLYSVAHFTNTYLEISP